MKKLIKSIKFYPVSLGCVKNQVDFEYLFGSLEKYKWNITDNYIKADVIIINTCAFIRDAKEESINEILSYSLEKPVIITGCLSQRYKETLIKLFPEINIFIGTESALFADKIDQWFRKKNNAAFFNYNNKYIEFSLRKPIDKFHTYIKISEGCNRNCAFCIIPNIRGNYRSRKIEDIINEVKNLYKKGFREFNIISEDSSLYGNDIYGKRKINDLIMKLDNIKYKDIYFRLLYVYPDKDIFETIDLISESKHFIKYIDMPLQHISKKILKKMNRIIIDGYKIAEHIKKRNLIFRTSLMVGFPYENENEFMKLYNFVKNGFIDKLGVFTYSGEEHTKSYNYKEKVHYKTALKRQKILQELQSEIVYGKMSNSIGKIKDAILYEKNNNEYYGRLLEDLHEVDDMLIVRKNNLPLYKKIKIKIKSIENMTYIG